MVTNRYGVRLDSNGYAPSLFKDDVCCLCNKGGDLARHEIFHGSNRNKSKQYGLWLTLCPDCHRDVHNGDGSKDGMLKDIGEKVALQHYGWSIDDFINLFGKNYL